ncbi:MAG: hypothetical protein AMXMBFR47_41070 [Planctomycetota bacterium]
MFRHLRKRPAWFIVIQLTASIAAAQERLWELRIDDPVPVSNRASAAVVDSDGNTFVAGTNVRSWVAWKVDPSGNLLWTWNEGLWYSDLQTPLKAALLTGGDLLIAGMGDGGFTIARLNPEGRLVSRRTDPAVADWRRTLHLHISDDGAIALVTSRDNAAVVRSYDGDGTPLWEHVYTSRTEGYDNGDAVWMTDTGDIYAGITSRLLPTSPTDIVILRLSAGGDLRYAQRINAAGSERYIVQKLVVDDDDRAFVFGKRLLVPDNSSMPLALMLNSQGQFLWQDIVDIPTSTIDFQSTEIDRDRQAVYAGGSRRDPATGFAELFLARYDAAGRSWAALSSGDIGSSTLTRLAVAADGSVRTIGNAPRANVSRPVVVQHYSAGGVLLDEWQYSSGAYFGDTIGAVALHPAGDIAAVLVDSPAPRLTRFASGGEPQWITALSSQVGRDEALRGAVSDGAGGLYVLTEEIWNDGSLTRIGPDGTILWRRLLFPTGRSSPRGVALDSAGRPVVSGLASGADAYFDPTVMRFSPDGELLSDRRCPVYPGGPDYVSAPVLDQFDNAYVTVISEQFNQYGSSTYHHRLTKIDPTGSIVWSVPKQGEYISVNGAGLTTLVGAFLPPRNPPEPRPPSQLLVNRFGPDGTLLWEHRWSLPGQSTSGSASVTCEDGAAFVIGSVGSTSTLPGYAAVLHYSPTGELLWVRQIDAEPPGTYWAQKIDWATDGDLVVVAAHAVGQGSQPRNPIVAKLSTSGDIRWIHRYVGLAGDEAPKDLLVSDDASIYVAGGYAGYTQDSYAYALRFDAAGSLHWRTTKVERPFSNAYHTAVPGPDGGIFLVGSGASVLSREDILVARFGPAPVQCAAGNHCTGDVDGDCAVGLEDLIGVLVAFGSVPAANESPANGDVTIDGQVSLADLTEVLGAFGTRCE